MRYRDDKYCQKRILKATMALFDKNKEKQLKRILILVVTRGMTITCQFVFQIMLARLVGAQGMGIFQLFITWLSTLGEAITLGRPANMMRHIAHLTPSTNRKDIIGFIIKSACCVIAFSVFISSGIYLIIHKLNLFKLSSELQQVLTWVCMFLLAYCLMRLFSESLKALGKTKLAVFLETGLIPCFMLLLLAVNVLTTKSLEISHITLLYGGIYYVVAFAMALVLYANIKAIAPNNTGEAFTANPLANLFSLSGDALLGIVFVYFPILFMPLYAPVSEVGITSAAFRYIALATTLLLVLASWFGPKFSKAYANDKPLLTRKLLWQSQLYSVALYLPFFCLFIFFAKPLLAVFGHEFISASNYLIILAFAQLVNAATGLPGILLKMIGKTHVEFCILLCTLICSILLLPWLGNSYGALGVIGIFAGAIVMKNGLSLIFAYNALKLNT